MSHSKQVMLSGAKVLGSQILINLFSIGFTIFLAHVLPKTDFATFAVFGILSGLIRMIVSLGLETSCVQLAPELIAKGKSDEASAMLKTTFLSRFFLSILLSFFTFAFSMTVSQIFLKNYEYAQIIKIMSLGLIFSSLIDSLGWLAQVTQQFGKISLIRVVVQISSRIFSIVLYFVLGLEGYIIGFTWTPIIGIILYLSILRKFLFSKSDFYPWWQLVKYSFPFYVRGFVRFGLMQFDQVIIGVFLEPAALATYFIAKRFSEYIFMISDALGNPLLIKIAELKKDGLNRVAGTFSRVSHYYSYVFIPLCFGVASTSYFLLHLYGGHKYTDGTFILVLLSLGMIMYCLSSPYAIDVFLLGKPKETLKLHSVGGITSAVFAVGTVFLFGVTGIATAKLLGFTALLFYGRHLLRKIIAVEFDKKALKDSLIASLAMAAVIVVLQLIYYNLVIIPLYILAGVITFMLIFSRRLERKDMELVEDFLPSRFKGLVKVFYWFGAKRLETLQTES